MAFTTSTMAKHTFFCTEPNCSRETALSQSKCPMCACPGCGDIGATIVGSDYCHTCLSVRDHPCNQAFIEDTCDGCTVQYRCTCDDSGRMCPSCDEESSDPCRGCGTHSLWDDRYCRECYEVRYGAGNVRVSDEIKAGLLANLPDKWSFTPAHPPLPPSPVRSPEELREIIAEIEARLLTNMTKGQKDDWIWILQNRRTDLAEAEKEMWEGYDQDDLNKMDLENRRGW